jgi:Stringent starvation protein B
MAMTSHRPYLVRALYEWILDNNCTPYILVNALIEGVEVPQNFVKDGQIVLNISPVAVQGLLMTNDGLEFNGRFGGIPTRVYVPMGAVMGIYARENGQGMIFEYGVTPPPPPTPPETGEGNEAGDAPVPSKSKPRGKPALKVVK